jgi:predicted metal-dependent phosphoesterase TrpH
MKIDFHVHTAERSNCATALQSEQIETAIQQGLDGIAITDHFRLVPPDELRELNQKFSPFRILPGIEITANREDWLILGLSDPILEKDDWSYPELHQFTRAKGGVIILAHPFRYHPNFTVDLVRYPPDGIEIRTVNIRSDSVPRIQELADRLKIPTLCNSDAHTTSPLGRYFNIFENGAASEAEIMPSLKKGLFHHLSA